MPIDSTQTANQQDKSSDAHNRMVCKVFNLCTYKIHALGHYIAAITQFGTTDNYSTQMVVDHIFSILSFTNLLFSRENLNISKSNVSMLEQINAKISGIRLPGSNSVNSF